MIGGSGGEDWAFFYGSVPHFSTRAVSSAFGNSQRWKRVPGEAIKIARRRTGRNL
jgi:hypothetical protein